MVPAVCGWHEHHGAAAAELERRLARAERMHIAGPALVEAYAVLPPSPTLHSTASLQRVPSRSSREASSRRGGPSRSVPVAYERLLRTAPAGGIAGGRVCDDVIAACTRAAGASTPLTFNERHFAPFAGSGLAVVVPSPGCREGRPDLFPIPICPAGPPGPTKLRDGRCVVARARDPYSAAPASRSLPRCLAVLPEGETSAM